MDFIECPTLHQYQIKLPDKFSSEKKYPLVIGLHGGSGTSINFIKLWDDLSGINFIFAAPQGPYPMVSDGELSFDWGNWPLGDDKVISKSSQLTEKYIETVGEDLRDKYHCEDVYLLGFSQGAVFSYRAGLKNSKFFKGMIILSGPGLLEPINNPFSSSKDHDWLTEGEIREAEKLRVFISHGKEDQNPKYEFGVKSGDLLSSEGHDVTFCDFDGEHVYPPKEILEEIAQWVVSD